jgi:hypothetical protein
MMIVNGPKSARSNGVGVVGVPDTTNLLKDAHINIEKQRVGSKCVPHQSRYMLKDKLIKVEIIRIFIDDA